MTFGGKNDVCSGWMTDYTVLVRGDGEKLEDVGGVVLQRPDPQVIWQKSHPEIWRPHAIYDRSDTGGGSCAFSKRCRSAGRSNWAG